MKQRWARVQRYRSKRRLGEGVGVGRRDRFPFAIFISFYPKGRGKRLYSARGSLPVIELSRSVRGTQLGAVGPPGAGVFWSRAALAHLSGAASCLILGNFWGLLETSPAARLTGGRGDGAGALRRWGGIRPAGQVRRSVRPRAAPRGRSMPASSTGSSNFHRKDYGVLVPFRPVAIVHIWHESRRHERVARSPRKPRVAGEAAGWGRSMEMPVWDAVATGPGGRHLGQTAGETSSDS